MNTSAELISQLKELEALILDNTRPDGSCSFETEPVRIALLLAKRLIELDK